MFWSWLRAARSNRGSCILWTVCLKIPRPISSPFFFVLQVKRVESARPPSLQAAAHTYLSRGRQLVFSVCAGVWNPGGVFCNLVSDQKSLRSHFALLTLRFDQIRICVFYCMCGTCVTPLIWKDRLHCKVFHLPLWYIGSKATTPVCYFYTFLDIYLFFFFCHLFLIVN